MADRVDDGFAALEGLECPLTWGDVSTVPDEEPLSGAPAIGQRSVPGDGVVSSMDEPGQMRIDAPRRHRWLTAVAVAVLIVAVAIAATALVASTSGTKAEPRGSRPMPRARIASLFAQASAISGERHPDHVRASLVTFSGFCPPAVKCPHKREYLVVGHGRFECQTCAGTQPVHGRYLAVTITRTLHISNYGTVTSARPDRHDHPAVRIPPPRYPANVLRINGSIVFGANGPPPTRAKGGATLRVTTKGGLLVAQQYVPVNGIFDIRVPVRHSDTLYWFAAVGARPACRIPLPVDSSIQTLQFDLPCASEAPPPGT